MDMGDNAYGTCVCYILPNLSAKFTILGLVSCIIQLCSRALEEKN